MPQDLTGGPPQASAAPAPPGAGWRARIASPGLLRAGLFTYLFSAFTLVANLISGVVSARALGPSGRGVTVALVAVAQLAGFIFAMGVAQSLSYFIAREPDQAPSLFTTWILILMPCAALAVLAGQLLLPTLFGAHTPSAVQTGRWFMFTIVLVVASELNNGLLLGAQDFILYNVLRFAQPALMAVGFVVLWRLRALTITGALIVPTVASALTLAVGMARSWQRIGLGPPRMRHGLTTLWYGVRGQGTLLATHVNARLDVAILPAYVAASSVGLYSVATNVSLIIFQLSSALASLVLPAAARDPQRSVAKVIGSLHGSLAVAAVLAGVLAVFAEPLLSLVYGHRFGQAATVLRLLLPGAVLFAGSAILTAGMYAAGRPFLASVAQLAAAAVTVVGLVVFLPRGGITAAAIVSSIAYATTFAVSLVAYRRVTEVPWRRFVALGNRPILR